jgi:hypothetical protein
MTRRDRYGEPVEEPETPTVAGILVKSNALREAEVEAKARQQTHRDTAPGRVGTLSPRGDEPIGRSTEVVARERDLGKTRALRSIAAMRRELAVVRHARTTSNDRSVQPSHDSTRSTTGDPS